jgi:hypothetical protein
LPARWDLTVVKRDASVGGSTVYFKWLPVLSWDQAGADVTFSERSIPFTDGADTREALAKLNRPNSRIYRIGGFSQLPFFDGRQWNGHFDGATTVTHEVCSLLTEELKHVFSALPSHDSAN